MKNYLIIGASSGIGKALAEQLASEGNQVFGTYNQTAPAASNIHFQQLDVLNGELDQSNFPDHFDGVAYCPGSINLLPFHRIKPADFVQDFELQVVGAIKVVQSILPKLKAADQASLLFFSTVAVQAGYNFHSQVATSKGAIEGLTRSLAAEFAPKIRVNCVAPSLTDTPLAGKLLNSEKKQEANAERHPLKRVGTPKDMAEMAAFLLSDKSSWMTGQVLHVDGGMLAVKG